MGTLISAPEKLTAAHSTEGFDSGAPALDDWFRRHALASQRADTTRTFVVCVGKRVAGFYSLAVGAVDCISVAPRIAQGVGRHPLPVMVLARLAVDHRNSGQGIGRGLLKDAILRTVQASEFAGIRALLVHAKDDGVRSFYEKCGFEPSPLDPLQLLLLMKDARKTLGL
ncbi:MAG TPA: GNAT family N-acetyltransferase [Rhodocyclaceae bacterium]